MAFLDRFRPRSDEDPLTRRRRQAQDARIPQPVLPGTAPQLNATSVTDPIIRDREGLQPGKETQYVYNHQTGNFTPRVYGSTAPPAPSPDRTRGSERTPAYSIVGQPNRAHDDALYYQYFGVRPDPRLSDYYVHQRVRDYEKNQAEERKQEREKTDLENWSSDFYIQMALDQMGVSASYAFNNAYARNYVENQARLLAAQDKYAYQQAVSDGIEPSKMPADAARWAMYASQDEKGRFYNVDPLVPGSPPAASQTDLNAATRATAAAARQAETDEQRRRILYRQQQALVNARHP